MTDDLTAGAATIPIKEFVATNRFVVYLDASEYGDWLWDAFGDSGALLGAGDFQQSAEGQRQRILFLLPRVVREKGGQAGQFSEPSADFNRDGTPDIKDAVLILRKIARPE